MFVHLCFSSRRWGQTSTSWFWGTFNCTIRTFSKTAVTRSFSIQMKTCRSKGTIRRQHSISTTCSAPWRKVQTSPHSKQEASDKAQCVPWNAFEKWGWYLYICWVTVKFTLQEQLSEHRVSLVLLLTVMSKVWLSWISCIIKGKKMCQLLSLFVSCALANCASLQSVHVLDLNST